MQKMVQLFSNLARKVSPNTVKECLGQDYVPISPVKDCYNTQLSEFIDMVVDGKWLYSEADWDNISEQFSELRKGKNVKAIFTLRKDIEVLVNKCKIIEEVINSLDLNDYAPLWAVLKRVGITANNIKAAKTQAQRYVHELAECQKELAKFVTTERATRESYVAELVTLGKHLGFKINANETTIAEYCAIANDYDMHIEAQKAELEKSKGNGRRFN